MEELENTRKTIISGVFFQQLDKIGLMFAFLTFMRLIFLLFLAIPSLPLFCQEQTADSLFITTSDSVRLFVKRSGTGYPLLFVHGGPGSNSFYFEKEGGNVFSKIVQIIYLDQRGCGRSDSAMNGDYSLGRVVKDFDEVRQRLGYKQWIVMAHSFGGILATEYAYDYLPTIKAMVYLNCTVNLPVTAASGLAKGVELLGNKPEDVKYFLNDSIPVLQRWGEIFGRLNERTWFTN